MSTASATDGQKEASSLCQVSRSIVGRHYDVCTLKFLRMEELHSSIVSLFSITRAGVVLYSTAIGVIDHLTKTLVTPAETLIYRNQTHVYFITLDLVALANPPKRRTIWVAVTTNRSHCRRRWHPKL